VALAPTGTSAARQPGPLKVSPSHYVGGQRMLFEGNLGVSGRRRIGLQFHMNRGGDGWNDVEGFRSRTKPDGSFRFFHPAPSMFGIRMRVVSGRHATEPWTFNARSQEVHLTLDGGLPELGSDEVLAGSPFTINVDTAPVLRGRQDLPPPVFDGRGLVLQQRTAEGLWKDLARTETDAQGRGAFTRTVELDELPTGGLPGTVAFRVVQADWEQAGSPPIGWFPSFPLLVQVLPDLGLARAATERGAPSAPPVDRPELGRTGAATTASQTHGWAPSLWDFAWEYGESLTSPPARGTARKGRWIDASDGTGRAAKHNGGLMLDSQPERSGDGDHGTTWVTLQGAETAYGRWEAKLRLRTWESGARDYNAVIELVPARAGDYRCGAQNITVADVPVGGSTVGVGVKALAKNRQWTRTLRFRDHEDATAFAVEVTKRHISWFMNGRVIGTVKSRAAVPDVPMTLRLSLVGGGPGQEMNKTQFISDWQRGFSLDRGRQVTNGNRLKAGTHDGGC
jgi:hypothetical protein